MNTTVDKVKNVVTRNIYVSLSASADQINFNEIFSITDPNIAPPGVCDGAGFPAGAGAH
ncbi:hypothetical protein [Aeromonas salmonicida]|uniref:hypothetical protein n=1 Tax=Aeromonas salmonicida TaxID=645 RepID=UPI002116EA48|nr:hypothetical protein [Aeromonas salmonicida]UUI58987.1 hypothetical protein NP805_12290 [Aeromonas salmonicida]